MKGGTTIKVLIPLLIFGIVAYIGIPVLISHLHFLAIEDRTKEMARFSRFYTRQEIIKKIIERAEENNVKIDSSWIEIWNEGNYTNIKFYYEDTLNYLNRYTLVRPYEVYVKEIQSTVKAKY
jgi:hypothetical protein